jgi:murein DD-endopeptidase MepM/ murein hydrolase activator NlpD
MAERPAVERPAVERPAVEPARKSGRFGRFGRRGKAADPVAEEHNDRVTRNPEAFAEAATAFAAGRRAAERKAPPPDQPTPIPAARKATEDTPADPKAPTAEPRRGLFGRRKPKSASAPPADPPPARPDIPEQPLKPKDEEYVDWVSGLAPGREEK